MQTCGVRRVSASEVSRIFRRIDYMFVRLGEFIQARAEECTSAPYPGHRMQEEFLAFSGNVADVFADMKCKNCFALNM